MCTQGFKNFRRWTPMGLVYNRHGAEPINRAKAQVVDQMNDWSGENDRREAEGVAARENKARQDEALKRANAATKAAQAAMDAARSKGSPPPMMGPIEEKKKQKKAKIRAARRRSGAATGKQQFIIPRIIPVNTGGGSRSSSVNV